MLRPQIGVNLGQIKIIRTLVGIVFVGALSGRRLRTSVVSRDPSFSISRTGKRTCAADKCRGSRHCPKFHSSMQLVCPQSLPGPPSAGFLSVHGFPWTIDNPVCDFGELFSPLKMMPAWVTWGCTLIFEVAFCKLMTVNLFPGVSGAFTQPGFSQWTNFPCSRSPVSPC